MRHHYERVLRTIDRINLLPAEIDTDSDDSDNQEGGAESSHEAQNAEYNDEEEALLNDLDEMCTAFSVLNVSDFNSDEELEVAIGRCVEREPGGATDPRRSG